MGALHGPQGMGNCENYTDPKSRYMKPGRAKFVSFDGFDDVTCDLYSNSLHLMILNV